MKITLLFLEADAFSHDDSGIRQTEKFTEQEISWPVKKIGDLHPVRRMNSVKEWQSCILRRCNIAKIKKTVRKDF